LIGDAYKKKINVWPKISANDGPALRKFSDFLENCNAAMITIPYLSVLDGPDENQRILKKLPVHLVSRWSRIVDNWLSQDDEEIQSGLKENGATIKPKYPLFKEFCKFLQREDHIACKPVTSMRPWRDNCKKETRNRGGFGVGSRSFAARAGEEAKGSQEDKNSDQQVKEEDHRPKQDPKTIKCIYCKENHELDTCSKFKDIRLTERKSFIKIKGLCWGCLKWGHIRKNCKRRNTCTECKRVHPTCLHEFELKREDSNEDAKDSSGKRVSNCVEVRSTIITDDCGTHSLIVPVLLYHENNPGKKRMVYALLDDQSDACFVKETTVHAFGTSGPDVKLKLSTVPAEEVVCCQRISGLIVRGVNEETEIHLPKTYTRTIIPARTGQIPRCQTAERWTHLSVIAPKMIPYQNNVEVGLLIGLTCSKAIKPK
jgi:hypothetical protein